MGADAKRNSDADAVSPKQIPIERLRGSQHRITKSKPAHQLKPLRIRAEERPVKGTALVAPDPTNQIRKLIRRRLDGVTIELLGGQ